MQTTPLRTAGLQAAADAYNAANPGTEEEPITPLTADEYWTKVFADYSGDETEQEVYDRATDSYCQQFGIEG